MSDLVSLEKQVRLLYDKIDLLEKKILPSKVTYSTREYGEIIGRGERWVSNKVVEGRIRSLTKERPFRIPSSEIYRAHRQAI